MNSRLTVSNHAFFNTLINNLVASAECQRVRAVAVIRSAPESWLVEFAQRHNHEYLPAVSTTDRSDRISGLLGSERLSAVIQLNHKPDYGLLAAVAGTVRAGGVFIIGLPDTLATPESPSRSLNRLIHLARRTAEKHANHMVFVDYIPDADLTSSYMSSSSLSLQKPGNQQAYVNPLAAAEQDALLEQAYRHITAHVHSRTVISGRRGRGKSTLMARLAAKLSQDGTDTRVTAMHESALSTYRQLPGNTGHYMSPESITKGSAVDALMVDEAASFPIAHLETYAKKCRHLVLSTTVEGYETAGRALALRMLPAADPTDNPANYSTGRQAILQLTPEHPWRWATNDPLEEFVDRLLLTHIPSGLPELESATPTDRKRLATQGQSRLIHQDELLADEALLANIHALLSSTHYQSGTKDLEHLLDATTVQLWIHQINKHVTGVLLLEVEGFIDNRLHEAILAKRRRIKNQLLPQLLAQMANSTSALSSGYARVIRIAVTPALRRQGIASAMLKSVTLSIRSAAYKEKDDCPVNEIGAIGASFAGDEGSLEFWQSQGYVEFHQGFRANPRTGKAAVAVMRIIHYHPVCSAILNRAVFIHNENMRARLKSQHILLPYCLSDDKPDKHISTITELDRDLLRRFAMGQRSLHDTTAAVHKVISRMQSPMKNQPGESRKKYEKALREHILNWLDNQ